MELCRKGEYVSALALITAKNPLPFITGTLCAHNCMNKCTRNYYDQPVNIRATKLVAAEKGYEELMACLKPPAPAASGPGRRHRRRPHRYVRRLLSGPCRHPRDPL